MNWVMRELQQVPLSIWHKIAAIGPSWVNGEPLEYSPRRLMNVALANEWGSRVNSAINQSSLAITSRPLWGRHAIRE